MHLFWNSLLLYIHRNSKQKNKLDESQDIHPDSDDSIVGEHSPFVRATRYTHTHTHTHTYSYWNTSVGLVSLSHIYSNNDQVQSDYSMAKLEWLNSVSRYEKHGTK